MFTFVINEGSKFELGGNRAEKGNKASSVMK